MSESPPAKVGSPPAKVGSPPAKVGSPPAKVGFGNIFAGGAVTLKPTANRNNVKADNAVVQIMAEAEFEYEAEQGDELSFNEGDLITVINQEVSDGWAEGSLNGKAGVFPSNFVRFYEHIEKTEPVRPVPSPKPARKFGGPAKVGAVNAFNHVNDEPAVLLPKPGGGPPSSKPPSGPPSSGPPPSGPPSSGPPSSGPPSSGPPSKPPSSGPPSKPPSSGPPPSGPPSKTPSPISATLEVAPQTVRKVSDASESIQARQAMLNKLDFGGGSLPRKTGPGAMAQFRDKSHTLSSGMSAAELKQYALEHKDEFKPVKNPKGKPGKKVFTPQPVPKIDAKPQRQMSATAMAPPPPRGRSGSNTGIMVLPKSAVPMLPPTDSTANRPRAKTAEPQLSGPPSRPPILQSAPPAAVPSEPPSAAPSGPPPKKGPPITPPKSAPPHSGLPLSGPPPSGPQSGPPSSSPPGGPPAKASRAPSDPPLPPTPPATSGRPPITPPKEAFPKSRKAGPTPSEDTSPGLPNAPPPLKGYFTEEPQSFGFPIPDFPDKAASDSDMYESMDHPIFAGLTERVEELEASVASLRADNEAAQAANKALCKMNRKLIDLLTEEIDEEKKGRSELAIALGRLKTKVATLS